MIDHMGLAQEAPHPSQDGQARGRASRRPERSPAPFDAAPSAGVHPHPALPSVVFGLPFSSFGVPVEWPCRKSPSRPVYVPDVPSPSIVDEFRSPGVPFIKAPAGRYPRRDRRPVAADNPGVSTASEPTFPAWSPWYRPRPHPWCSRSCRQSRRHPACCRDRFPPRRHGAAGRLDRLVAR